MHRDAAHPTGQVHVTLDAARQPRYGIALDPARDHIAWTDALRVFDVNLRQTFHDAGTIDASLRLASAVKLNDEELPIVAASCGIRGHTPRETLREMMVRYDLRLAALTRGPRGALLMHDRGEDECAAPTLTAVDTVGAGDAFTATLVSGFLRGLPLAEINVHANAVASFVCSQAGATPPLPDHLRPHL